MDNGETVAPGSIPLSEVMPTLGMNLLTIWNKSYSNLVAIAAENTQQFAPALANTYIRRGKSVVNEGRLVTTSLVHREDERRAFLVSTISAESKVTEQRWYD